jgi:GDPmannose 4,6-dehydratase
MWRMLQAEKPDDYVLATNQTHTVREFIEEAFAIFGEKIVWHGEKANEIGILVSSGKTVIEIHEKYYRPTEVDILIGNPEKAEKLLGWKPSTTFKELVKIMTLSDYENLKPRLI